MKKKIKKIISVLIMSVFFSGIIFAEKTQENIPSPDEAVLVYVIPSAWWRKVLFTQPDPNKPVSKVSDILQVNMITQCMYGFCIPDTDYVMVYQEVEKDHQFTLYYSALNYPSMMFTTQKEPGVQLLTGDISAESMYKKDDSAKWIYNNQRKDTLKKLISKFKGTDWEPLLRKELEKVQEE
ncbi:MAG: hypothetical protein HUJ68_09330 [Clostridia bacterium]|nr:hypothetical protein [Clostridia bacterium]